MKIVYINLDKSTDRRAEMSKEFPTAERLPAVDGTLISPKEISPYVADKTWRDPSWNRRLTKGEIGCILSHIQAWKLCIDINEPIIVLEDDVQILDNDYERKAEKYIELYDFVYLAKRYIEGETIQINKEVETPGFCYWCAAYAIRPSVALFLVKYFENNSLIPADEIVPAVLNLHRDPKLNLNTNFTSCGFIENLIEPKPNALERSLTEIPTQIWEDYSLHIVTVATDKNKASKLFKTPGVINLGEGVEWKGGNMALGPGGGQKLNLLKNYLLHVQDNDIILFLDGYDTFIHKSEEEILQRYFGFRKEIVFSAEKTCWPDESLKDLFPETGGYKYLNSGSFIGTAKEIKKLLELPILDEEDDQLYLQQRYLTGKYDIALDYESYIFLCMSGLEDSIGFDNGWIINEETNCTTCIVHGNGGEYTKHKFDELHRSVVEYSSDAYTVTKLSDDIIVIENLFSDEWCNKVISEVEKFDFKPLDSDVYPAQEVRMDQIDKEILKEYLLKYEQVVIPIAEKYWPKLTMYGIRDLFTIKYSLDSQTSLRLHHDMSLVTGSMKLNDEYVGGVLNFPRQGVDNSNVSKGSLILWPGQVTHPHECLELVSGVKYSLTMWTSRMQEGDSYGNYTL